MNGQLSLSSFNHEIGSLSEVNSKFYPFINNYLNLALKVVLKENKSLNYVTVSPNS